MSIEAIKSLNRTKYKRAANALVRNFNKSIKADWLWNGRFVLSQQRAEFQCYEDHSGGLYTVWFVLTDTKTNKSVYANFDNYDMDWRIWEWANKSITETWSVWDEDPNPNQQARLEGREPPNVIC